MRGILQRFRDFRSEPRVSDEAPEVMREVTPEGSASAMHKSKPKKASIASWRFFVPLIALWGAALGALSVLVLPISLVLRIAMATGLSGLGASAAYVFAALAALAIGAIAVFAAIAFKRSELGFESAFASVRGTKRDIEPIDPTEELGSDSLDAPIEIEPLLVSEIDPEFDQEIAALKAGPVRGNEAGRDENLLYLVEDQICEAAESDEFDVPGSPRELNLAEFAEMPGRNGVWIEEQTGEQARETGTETGTETGAETGNVPLEEAPLEAAATVPLAARIAPSAPTALEKLRQAPVQELSIVHMVERFAAALHDHQDAARRRPGSHHLRENDAALAEALRALTMFSETGFSESGFSESGFSQSESNADSEFASKNADALRDTTRELRDALAKLQDLRGAA